MLIMNQMRNDLRIVCALVILSGWLAAILFYNSIVNAQTTPITLADDQTVIVKSESPLEANDVNRIGKTDYYRTTMRVVRILK